MNIIYARCVPRAPLNKDQLNKPGDEDWALVRHTPCRQRGGRESRRRGLARFDGMGTKPWLRLSSGTYWLLKSAIPINVSAGTTIRASPCHKELLILVLARCRYLSHKLDRREPPLLISAVWVTEHLGADLDTAAHYVRAASGACRPHHLDRAFDPVKLHQPTDAPDLERLVVFVAAYLANSHRSSR
jgi:hypothetical protein